MDVRLPSIQLSKYTLLVAAQLVINVCLGAWLYDEYLHNPFMQAYVSSAWSSIWPITAVMIGIAVGATGAFIIYRRGQLATAVSEASQPSGSATGSLDNLETINDCPFCNLPLKTISEGRLQCRSCRRYFKSSMPKATVVSA